MSVVVLTLGRELAIGVVDAAPVHEHCKTAETVADGDSTTARERNLLA